SHSPDGGLDWPFPGAVSSVGRAPARQAGGHWFEPSTAHQESPAYRGFFFDRSHKGAASDAKDTPTGPAFEKPMREAGSAADPPPAADPTVNGKAGSGAELPKHDGTSSLAHSLDMTWSSGLTSSCQTKEIASPAMWGGHAAQVWTHPGRASRRVVRRGAGWLALSLEHDRQPGSFVLSDGRAKPNSVPGSSRLGKFLVAVAREPWGEESRNRLLPHRFTKHGREWAEEAAKHATRHRVPKLDARFLADLKATEDGREGVVVLRIGEGASYRGKVREWAHEHNVGVTTKMARLEDYDVVFIDFWKRPDSEEEYEELLRQREQRYRERRERQCEEEDRYWWVAPRY